MIWYEKLKTFDFNHVKNIAKKYGKNKIIAEKLGLTNRQFRLLKYENKTIIHKEYRELAVKFAIVNQRQNQYSQNLDGARAELLDSVLNNLASQGLLNETQMEALKSIQTTRANIKEQYPKQS